MQLSGLFGLVRLVGELGVTEFIPQLAPHDLPILDGRHKVIGCTSEMLADGLSIVCDGCNFHLDHLLFPALKN
jgi:hypothetical protein